MKAHKQPPTEDALAFLRLYGAKERLGRPRERIISWAATIHHGAVSQLRDGALPSDLLKHMVATDLRLIVFYLEGILKLYRRRYPRVEDLYSTVKDLEDRLGHLSALVGFTAMARRVCAPEPAILHLQATSEAAHDALQRVLEESWLPGREGQIPVLSHLIRVIEEIEWDGYKADRKYLRKEMRRRLKKFDNLEFDMHELQGDIGIHELRRQLRWFSIYATATRGLVQLGDDNPIKSYKPMLKSKLAKSRYSKLPEPTYESKPFTISRSLFIANNGFIAALGKIKDRGEEIEALEMGLCGGGLYPDTKSATTEALALLGHTEADQENIFVEAQTLYTEIKERGFIGALRASLK